MKTVNIKGTEVALSQIAVVKPIMHDPFGFGIGSKTRFHYSVITNSGHKIKDYKDMDEYGDGSCEPLEANRNTIITMWKAQNE